MKTWLFAAIGAAVSLLLVVILSPYASDKPDGLEYVAEEKGFLERTQGKEVLKSTPLPDYSVEGIESERASTVIAGVIGTAVCLGGGLALAFALKARKKGTDEARASG
jgi:cobalt/nickel transport protein